MKNLLILICLFLVTNLSAQTTQDTIDKPFWQSMMSDRSININKTRRAFDLYFSNKPMVKGSGYKQFERWYHYWSAKVDEFGNFPAPDRTVKEFKKFLRNNLTARSATGNWTNVGPLTQPGSSTGIPIGTGRVSGIAFHPTDANTIYAGAANGGFWKSTNKGASWITTTDAMATLGVADIAVDQGSPHTIYLGTGDRDAFDANGLGVYKSTDNGATFTASNTGIANLTVNKVLVNKLRNQTIVIATNNGVYISYNSGGSWALKSGGGLNFKDLKYCPNDTNTMYGTVGGNFYKSTNAGGTWAINNTGLSTPASNRVRMAIAVTEANPNVVYLVGATGSGLDAIYKSTDKGATFVSKATTPTMFGNQGWYDIAIESSNTDENIVYVGGNLNIYKSTNSGSTYVEASDWTGSGSPWVHADIHYLGRNPLNNELWVGSDGSIDYTTNEGASYTHCDNGLAISQIYNLGVSQKSKTRFISGLQDNGTLVGSNSSNWMARVGGDGMQCEISNFDTTVMFGNIQYGLLRRSTNGGANWTDVDNNIPGGVGSGNAPWAAPCHLHPNIPDIMVNITKNAHVSKNIVTFATPTFTSITSGVTSNGSAIRFSNVNNDLVFMGWSNGSVRYCANLSAATPTSTLVTNPNGGNSINDLETSFNDENKVYACSGTEVYRSNDKGVTWTNISANLPNITMYSIVLDKNSPEGLYVGTEAGVYYKDSLSANWSLFNSGIPNNSDIRDLEIVYDTTCTSGSVIYAATFGRGLWKGDLYISETQPNPNFNLPASTCTTIPVVAVNTTTSIVSTPAAINYQWSVSPSTGFAYTNSTSNTSVNPEFTFSTPGTYIVTLKAFKSFGGFCTSKDTIVVGNKGTINLKTTNDTTICPGDTVLIKVGGLKTYTFTPNTNVTIFNDSNAYVFPTSATNYMIVGSITGGCFDTTFVDVKMKSAPAYTMTGTPILCAGDTVTIGFTGVDTAIWTPNTFTSFVTETSRKVYPTTNTSYNVRLIKPSLCDIKIVLPVKVLIKPTFALTKTGTQSICLGDSIDINETNNVPKIDWSPTSNVSNISANNFRFRPTVSSKYYIKSIDTAYCAYVKDSVTINVVSKPVITISGITAVCGGASVPLIAKGATTYTWSPNLYLSATNKDTVISTPTGTITYTVSGSNGTCSSTATHTINVGTNSVIVKVAGKTDVCLGSTIKLVASGASSYKWSPASLVSNEFGDTIRVSTTTNTTLKLIGLTTGCKDSIIVPITIYPIPTVVANLNNTNPICAGFTNSVVGTGAASYYIDPLYNVTQKKFDSFVLKPNQTTKYFIYGVSTNGCQSRDSFEIMVNPSPVINITPSITTIDKGDSINITASGGASYLWTPTTFIRTANNLATIRVKPDSTILYNVKVTTASGCIGNGIAIIYVLNKVKPNSSILSSDLENIIIYPNPSSDYINIESTELVKASIYNLAGSQVYKSEKYLNKQEIDVKEISAGNYILILESNQGTRKITKIEITK